MFRPFATIIRFSFESMVVALIGLVWLYHDGEISTSVMFAIVKGHRGRGGSVMCVILGCIAQVCLLAAVLSESIVYTHTTGMTHFRILVTFEVSLGNVT